MDAALGFNVVVGVLSLAKRTRTCSSAERTAGTRQVGHVDFVIKVYFPNVEPRFPEGGKMSMHLEKLEVCCPLLAL